MKLGEVLVAEGTISEKQLKIALGAQLRYGGHLGTCLVELGYVSDERLAEALSRSYGVPFVPAAAFREIPRSVINAIPKSAVEKHMTVPVRMRDGILDVAMVDPKNLGAIDELRFVSGLTIQSWIAPELRIYQAMEQYYDIPRRIRYVTLCHALDKERSSSLGGVTGMFGQAADNSASEANTSWLIPSAAAFTGTFVATSPARPVSAAAPTVAFVSSSSTAASSSPAAVATMPAADSLSAVSELLCGAKTEDQVAELVLGAMYGDIPRRILFKVSGSNAHLWRTAGVAIDQDVTTNVKFPLLTESIFGLLRGEAHYSGPLPSDPMLLGFYKKLGIEKPANVLLLPVHLDDQLIAMFYGDGGRQGAIRVDIENHRRLLEKAALAVNVVRTKAKIRAL